jgi:hypothetical protein
MTPHFPRQVEHPALGAASAACRNSRGSAGNGVDQLESV